MPFLDDTPATGLAPQGEYKLNIETPLPPFEKLLEAAHKDQGFTAALSSLSEPARAPFDPAFDPWANIKGYEDYAASFAGDNTPDEISRTKRKIDEERRRSEMLSDAGASGIAAGVLAGMANPINLVPVGGQVYRAGTLGGRLLAGAARVGATGAATATADEILAQRYMETRTAGESAINIAASGLLAGLLGGAASGLARSETRALADGLYRRGDIFEREYTANTHADVSTVGAAAVRGTTLEQETLTSALGAEKALAFGFPTMRLANSADVEVRRLVQELADIPLEFRKNAEGIPTPVSVESRIRMWQAPLYESMTGIDDLFVKYRLGRDPKFGDIAKLGVSDLVSRPDKLSYNEFMEAVGKSMRRGDQSDIPEVAKAAGLIRKKLFDPLKDRAIEHKLLPEDVQVETALSYLTRVYNLPKIAARRPEFEQRIVDWLSRMQRDAKGRAAEREGTKKLAKTDEAKSKFEAAFKDDDAFAKMDAGDMKDIARQITDTLMHASPGRSNYTPIPLKRGPLKERTFSIPDEDIEDFLESNIRHVSRIYARTMAADVEMTRQFGRADMQEQIDTVLERGAVLREGVTDERKLKALNADMQDDLRDLTAIRDRLRHTYAMPENPSGLAERAWRVVRDLNYLRLMGGMTLSSIPDAGRMVMVHGITRTVRDGLVPMVKNFQGFRLKSAKETKLAGTALDMVLDTRAMQLADVLDDYGRWSKIERGIQGATSYFGIASLMAPWNAAMKQFAGMISQTRTLQAIQGLADGSASQRELTRLAALGIGKTQAAKIARQFATHGEEDRGVRWANTSAWTDPEAVEAFRNALAKEVDATIISPGQEKPLWMSKGIGRMLGQFRSFSMSSTQRVLISGLQQRDMATLNGALLMTGLGMLSYWAKTDSQKLSDIPGVWVSEGVDRSGLTGYLYDVNNIMEKATRGAVGVSAFTKGPTASRYQSRGILESILGPTPGLVNDAAQIVGSAANGDWKEADTRAVRKMIPAQNLIGWKHLFDEAEAGINETFGIPVKPPQP